MTLSRADIFVGFDRKFVNYNVLQQAANSIGRIYSKFRFAIGSCDTYFLIQGQNKLGFSLNLAFRECV